MKKVSLITLGCPRNTVDSEVIAEIISRGNYVFTAKPEEADIILINTCGFIKSAEQESLDKVEFYMSNLEQLPNIGDKLSVKGDMTLNQFIDLYNQRQPEAEMFLGALLGEVCLRDGIEYT